MPPDNYKSDQDLFGGVDFKAEREASAAKEAKKAATNERNRQKRNADNTARRADVAAPVESRPNSVFQETSHEGPGGQQRLFGPAAEPEAFETKWGKRARTERTIQPAKKWADLKGVTRGTSQADVRSTLAEQGVTTRGAKKRLRDTWKSAQERADGGMPKGQDFYAHEQADKFDQDAKHFGVPFNVALAVNAVMSPKTALATSHGFQTNREDAHRILKHVLSGKPGVPQVNGLKANAAKATEIVRQHLANGTHPLDVVDHTGKHVLSGPKVEEYYSSYIDPSRSPTDIQHSRILFGPGVRSELSPEENQKKKDLIEEYGKDSEEVGRYIPKSPGEKLLSRTGVHEWAAHVTGQVAKEMGVHPAEFQSADWHEHKTQRGGNSSVSEVQPLFASRKKPKSQGRQRTLPHLSASQFKLHPPS